AEAQVFDVVAWDQFSLEIGSQSSTEEMPIGKVVLGLSLEILQQAEHEQITSAIVMVLLAACLTLAVVYVVFRGWQNRFDALLENGRNIAAGDYRTSLTDDSADEIGVITRVLDEMRRAIRERDIELRSLNKDLSAQVEDRTVELEEALVDAKAQSVAKSRFLANMSHEIRTPMNGILGMGQILEDTQLSDDQSDLLRTMMVSGDSLLSIINDILDFSKIESGKLDIERIEFSLRTLIADILDIMSERAQEKGLILTSIIEIDVPDKLKSDPVRIRQILLNLLTNAIKFTDEGEVKVVVSRDENETDKILFQVIDTGIGIAGIKQQGLFHAFTQADASTTRIYGGTGLGLSISKRLCDLLGGAIGIHSTLGEGATFYFDIQVDVCDQPPADLRLQGLSVIGVEGNAALRQQLDNIFATLHCSGRVVHDLETLFAVMSEEDYEILLLPSHIDNMQGVELVKAVKERFPNQAMIYMAEIIRRQEFDAIREYGVLDCVTIPLRSDNVGKILRRIQRDGKSTGKREAIRSDRLAAKRSQMMKVLLAEDNIVNQKVAQRMLEAAGCEVEVVGNGVQAFAAAQRTYYDAIFMDCMMPEMDGYEATRLIRENSANTKTPIIALTANALSGDRERCMAAGMDDFVAKPVRRFELSDTLQKWVIDNESGYFDMDTQ
ncbi:MAG: response regulator, partial [Planctomycetes bacterium]|nr:response regulator [Planctomycetota bacterium]